MRQRRETRKQYTLDRGTLGAVGAEPAVCDEHTRAFAVSLQVLPKDEVASENGSAAANALFCQDFIVIEIFDHDAPNRFAATTVDTMAVCMGLRGEMS